MKILSGIQPTGRFHWGNYFGAIRQYIALQGHEQSFYFIADLHALTTVREPERPAAERERCSALDLLALGLDPQKATLVSSIGCTGNDGTDLAADDDHANAFAGEMPRLQGQKSQGQSLQMPDCLRIRF
jgi:hypothetical protein